MDEDQASPASPYDSASPGVGHKAAAVAILRLGQPKKGKHRRKAKASPRDPNHNSGADFSSLARHSFPSSTTNPIVGSGMGDDDNEDDDDNDDDDNDDDDGGSGSVGIPFRTASPNTTLQSLSNAHLAPKNTTANTHGDTGSVCLSAASPELAASAETNPLPPLLEHAFHKKGPLDYETMKLIAETLTEMEEEFEYSDKERSLNWDDVADEFCGCSRDDLVKWYLSLGSFIEAEENCSAKTMALLLRSFFDHQFSLMNERSMMEKNKMIFAAATLDAQKIRCVEGFLANAEKDFEKALWTYFIRDWIH